MKIVKRWYSIILLVAVWQTISHFEWVRPFFLPSVTTILDSAWEGVLSGRLLWDIYITMYRSLVSFFLAIMVGVPLGAMMARIPVIKWFFDPILSIALPSPKVTFIPLFILWFGFSDLSKILLSLFACVFPVINTTYLGTIGIDRYFVWSARNMGTNERKLFWRVVLPAALPQIFSGFQIAFPISLIVVTVTEMLRGGGGIGDTMMRATRFMDMPLVFVNLVVLALVGSASMALLARLRKYLLHWHEETRAAA